MATLATLITFSFFGYFFLHMAILDTFITFSYFGYFFYIDTAILANFITHGYLATF